MNFQTQKVDGEIDMGVEYQRYPIAVQQSTYIEVRETELLKVDYKAMDKVEKVELPKPFPKFIAPCYTQFEGSMIIQNSQEMYLLNLDDGSYQDFAKLDSPVENGLFLHPSTTEMWFLTNEKHILHADGAKFTKEDTKFDGTGKCGMILNSDEFISTNKDTIVKVNAQTGEQELVFQGTGNMDGCVINPAGIYLVVIDQNGLGQIISSNYAQRLNAARCGFELTAQQQGKPIEVADGKIEKVANCKLPEGSTGASFTGVLDSNTLVVRQGEFIHFIEFSTQTVKKSLKTRLYEPVPTALFEGKLYELRSSLVTVFDLSKPEEEPQDFEHSKQFPDMFDHPSYLQFGSKLMVQNLSKIFIFDLITRQWKMLDVQVCPEQLTDAMLLVPSDHTLSFAIGNKIASVDTEKKCWELKNCGESLLGCFGGMLSAEQYLAIRKAQIIMGGLSEPAQVMFSGNDMSQCAPAYAGQYMVLVDATGELCVFQSAYFQQL